MTALKWLLIVAVVGYGGLLALMYVFQRALQYFPDPTRVAPAQAGLPQAEEVTLTSSDGEKLIAWFTPATGAPTEAGLIRDAGAAYDFARARYPANRIVLFGESLGTGVAIALASEHEIGALILDAPYDSIAAVGTAHYPFAPVRWLMKDSFHSDRRIGRVSAPLLVVHGEQDRIVPIRFGERLFALAREPKRMVRFPQGGHVNLDDYGAAKVIREFLAGAVGSQKQ
jgi:hypothetical protein